MAVSSAGGTAHVTPRGTMLNHATPCYTMGPSSGERCRFGPTSDIQMGAPSLARRASTCGCGDQRCRLWPRRSRQRAIYAARADRLDMAAHRTTVRRVSNGSCSSGQADSACSCGALHRVTSPLGFPVTRSPSLKGRGFSVHRRDYCPDSPKGLSGPLDISGRVLVAVQHQPTGVADMDTNGERFFHPFATPAAILRGERRRNRHHSTPGPCCLGFEDGTECGPPSIADALGELMIPDHVADLQIFQIDRVGGSQQCNRRLMMKVCPLAPHMLMLAGQHLDGLFAAVAALLAAGG